jgi:hypothetical protein
MPFEEDALTRIIDLNLNWRMRCMLPVIQELVGIGRKDNKDVVIIVGYTHIPFLKKHLGAFDGYEVVFYGLDSYDRIPAKFRSEKIRQMEEDERRIAELNKREGSPQ